MYHYTKTRITNIKLHYLNNQANKEERKIVYYCDFGNFSKGRTKLHMDTKHNYNSSNIS
jgi:hypothetical protein